MPQITEKEFAVIGIRALFVFLLKLIPFARRRLTLKEVFHRSLNGEETWRFASFFGIFGLLWKFTYNKTRSLRGKEDRWNSFIAGTVAGAAVLVETPQRRVALAQQFSVRAAQCTYNAMKSRSFIPAPLSRFGDSLIFALASAQVMYCYSFRPKSLDSSFYNFIVQTGPINKESLKDFRTIHSRGGLDIGSIIARFTEWSKKRVISQHVFDVVGNLDATPALVPCEILHPFHDSCTQSALSAAKDVTKKIFPVYATLNFVPPMMLKFQEVLKR